MISYLLFNLVVSLVALTIWSLKKLPIRNSALGLKLSQGLLITGVFIVLASPFLTTSPEYIFPQKFEVRETLHKVDLFLQKPIQISDQKISFRKSTGKTKPIVWVLLLTISILGSLVLLYRLNGLRKFLKQRIVIRKLANIEISVHDSCESPMSIWWGRSLILLPTRHLGHAELQRIAFLHEAQHIRQGDLVMSWLLETIRSIFVLNPFSHLLLKEVHEIQEFACDEALIGRQKVSPLAYGRCLLRAAQQIRGRSPQLIGATQMASSSSSELKRRIEMLYQRKKRGRWLMMGTITSIAVVIFISAIASAGYRPYKNLTLERAKEITNEISSESEYPIEMNNHILIWLNHFITNPKRRVWIKESKERMKSYKEMISKQTQAYGFPKELLAVPLIESGYKNLGSKEEGLESMAPGLRGAGIWMFIPSTAKRFRMRVNSHVDDRLDPARETIAAMDYYQKLFEEFGDWNLAVVAYNMGESYLRKVIYEEKTRDPWTLYKRGKINTYLPKVIAAMIILKEKSLIQ